MPGLEFPGVRDPSGIARGTDGLLSASLRATSIPPERDGPGAVRRFEPAKGRGSCKTGGSEWYRIREVRWYKRVTVPRSGMLE